MPPKKVVKSVKQESKTNRQTKPTTKHLKTIEKPYTNIITKVFDVNNFDYKKL